MNVVLGMHILIKIAFDPRRISARARRLMDVIDGTWLSPIKSSGALLLCELDEAPLTHKVVLAERGHCSVILSAAKDLNRDDARILRSFAVFAAQDDTGSRTTRCADRASRDITIPHNMAQADRLLVATAHFCRLRLLT